MPINSTTSTRLKKGSSIAAAAIALVAAWEGVRTVAYKDIVGVPTVCFGETRGVKMGDRYTMEECRAMLGDGLVEFEAGMRACLTKPDSIPEKPYVAFLSLSYNIGTRAFCGSTVARRANVGDIRGACNAITMWDRAGGRVVQGLVNRRAEERKICLQGAI
ncbi:lysozyme [Agrobacterium sp. Ap1]|uniref:lysozyme n=1 Tax=Agrobacterium sp. Ap1 TaxID=2815337 RepID=UPI001A8DCF04|nr:lysozyme [Agrobacterium sp. Ap1]MBO0141520.1 lysozyme [Agrobacterium sp. Ap1]